MQLTPKASIRGALTAITAALLGSGAAQAAEDNRVESSILLYSETNRVQAAEGLVGLTHLFKGDRLLNVRLTLDGLTGASPNGATPSSRVQTFTRPSGNGGYSLPAGEIPLDDTFRDTRYSVDGSLTLPLDRLTSVVFGAHFSGEHDYTSLGANIGFTRDFNRKNTTLSASAAISHDVSRPEGGAPIPLSSMSIVTDGEEEIENEGEDDDVERGDGMGKNVYDAVFGVTQVLDRKTVLRLNYSYNHSSGYQNDPYKILSVVQGPQAADPGEPVDYVYESRPDGRTKHAIYTQVRRYIGGHTIDLSYRYFWDDWGVKSKTVDFYYRFPLAAGHALQPHFRWYRQTEADFYRSYLLDGSPLPSRATADYRLAPFHAITVGLQYLFPVGPDAHLSIGAEYYGQFGDLSPPTGMGALSRYNLFPDMDAMMVRVGYSHDF
jgi:hypothetical protein